MLLHTQHTFIDIKHSNTIKAFYLIFYFTTLHFTIACFVICSKCIFSVASAFVASDCVVAQLRAVVYFFKYNKAMRTDMAGNVVE